MGKLEDILDGITFVFAAKSLAHKGNTLKCSKLTHLWCTNTKTTTGETPSLGITRPKTPQAVLSALSPVSMDA